MPIWNVDITVGAAAIVMGHDVVLGMEGSKGRSISVCRKTRCP